MKSKSKREVVITIGKEAVLAMLNKYNIILEKLNKQSKEESFDETLENLKEKNKKLYYEYLKLYFKIELLAAGAEEKINEDVEKLYKIIEKVVEVEELDVEELKEKVRQRDLYKANSGSEAVRNLFEYQIKEFQKKLNEIKETHKNLLFDMSQAKKNMENSIQESEGQVELEKILKTEKLAAIEEEKIMKLEKSISDLKNKLEERWHYEIYGTISADDLKETILSGKSEK